MANTKAAEQAKELARANFEKAARQLTGVRIAYRTARQALKKAQEAESLTQAALAQATTEFYRAADDYQQYL